MNIGRLAARHGLSRSTLLYYDRIGLLRPSGRLTNGYRSYTEADAARLARICLYRNTGLALRDVARVIGRTATRQIASILEAQLAELANQIDQLRARQRLIIDVLQDRRLLEKLSPRDRDGFIELLRRAGLADVEMAAWHRDFERLDPRYHQRFLEHLGLDREKIATIRRRSRDPRPGRTVVQGAPGCRARRESRPPGPASPNRVPVSRPPSPSQRAPARSLPGRRRRAGG